MPETEALKTAESKPVAAMDSLASTMGRVGNSCVRY